MKYKIGDLLVKRRGKSKILLITNVKFEGKDIFFSGREHYTLELSDMDNNKVGNYHSEHVDNWLNSLYKHYPVKA